ncbi:MAG: hypothetical protein JWQ35_1921 [Bacteriovoracaceae bacterium]|nr:hypothetical protein [Bacteriovoracaceae bacterium]
MKSYFILILPLFFFLSPNSLTVAESPSIKISEAFKNLKFDHPVFLTYAPDSGDRIFVVEQYGTIRVFENKADVSDSKIFLDVSSKVLSPGTGGGNEEGLLGLAFDPEYRTNKTFYIYYIANQPERTVVARYHTSVDPNKADAASEEKILEVSQPYSNHKGGMIAFGPDHFLYVGLGDGGSGGDPHHNGQNKNVLLAKILRIDPHPSNGHAYSIPVDNPFVQEEQEVRKEIFAYGLRNPWRFSFDRVNGDLWVGDVGQDAWEEVDLVKSGDNMGWNYYEGTHAYEGTPDSKIKFKNPILEYSHKSGTGFCITGGYVYRGSKMPSLYGAYIYGDYGTGGVWALRYDGSNVVSNEKIGSASTLASFGEDQSGEIYLISHSEGKIYTITQSNQMDEQPAKLSQTGLFQDLARLIPSSELREYDLQIPFWSDGAEKKRWIKLPSGGQIEFDAKAPWKFPNDTVFIKHFEIKQKNAPNRRLETRVLKKLEKGWRGYTYKWNESQTDADLLDASVEETIKIYDGIAERTQVWKYPSRSDCLTCHQGSAGRVLGLKTLQLNKEFEGKNELDAWNQLNLFTKDIGEAKNFDHYPKLSDESVSIAKRARAYIATNCTNCHQPGGLIPGMDFRYETSRTQMHIMNIPPAQTNLGVPNAMRVKPGKKEESILWLRMSRRGANQMPPLSSTVIDETGKKLLGDWIDAGAE